MGVVVFASIPPQVGQVFVCGQCSTLECSFYLLYTQFFCFLPGFLFTLIFLFCCSCPNNCSCSSPSFCFFSSSINASCSCYPPLKFGVFRPSSPLHQEIEAVEEIALEDNQVDSNERGKAETMGVEEKEEEVWINTCRIWFDIWLMLVPNVKNCRIWNYDLVKDFNHVASSTT